MMVPVRVSTRLIALGVGLAVAVTSQGAQSQAPTPVTVIITLRTAGTDPVVRSLQTALATAADAAIDPYVADTQRARAFSVALRALASQQAAPAQEVEEELRRLGGVPVARLPSQGLLVARLPPSSLVALRAHPAIAAVDLDERRPALLDIATATMGLPAFWNAGFTGGSSDVAVVDSGLYLGHLAFIARASSVRCGVFHTAAQSSPSYADLPSDCDDLAGHGTMVSGMIFSQGTSTFPTRLGASFGIDLLYNLKAAYRTANGSASLSLADLFTAIDVSLAQADPPEVINFSYGVLIPEDDSLEGRYFDGVVDTFGTTVTVAAGNSGFAGIESGALSYNAIAVANVDSRGTVDRGDDVIHPSSSVGPTLSSRRKPDLGAPGTAIVTTSTLGGFVSATGTSFAAPAIAGAAALLIHAGVSNPRALKAVMLNSADDLGAAGWDPFYGWGYFNGTNAFAQRGQVFLQTIGAPSSSSNRVHFYARDSALPTRITAVWHRHIAPAPGFLNNIDLRLFSQGTGALRAQSVSGVDNVEQVASGVAETAVVVAQSSGAFTGASDTYALAHSGGFVPRTGVGVTVSLETPPLAAPNTTFTVSARAINDGDLVGHQYVLTLTLPPGFQLVAGANPAAVGTIAPTANAVATWTVRAPATVSGTPATVVVHGDTTSYGWVWSGSASAGIIVGNPDADGDGLPGLWEAQFGLNPDIGTGEDGASGDPDADGRTNAQELAAGTHPRGFFHRYLAEGALNAFFDVRLALLNVGAGTAHVQVRLQQPGGTTGALVEALPPLRRRTLTRTELAPLLTAADFSTVVEADQPIVLDRTMSWDTSGYGSHADTAVAGPATTWYLAEGSTSGDFSLFYLLQNPNPIGTLATVRYLLPLGQAPIDRHYNLAPNSRTTIAVDGEGPAFVTTDVSAVITSGVPIMAERAMYFSRPGQPFAAGHDSAGVTAPATSWFLAEGATGPFFDLFLLLANPNPQAAAVTIDYLLTDGTTYSKAYAVPGNSRATVWVDDEQIPSGSGVRPLDNVAVSSTITSTNGVPIIVERTMWWPSPAMTPNYWTEAHNSAGATATGTRWALAEGEVGGPQHAETYVLIANTSATAGAAAVTLYFEDGTSVIRTFALAPRSRTNVSVSSEFPTAAGRRFAAIIESLGPAAAQIVVERAMYTSPGGVTWAAGTDALATRLP